MKSVPVIFLAFANDRVEQARYLRNLPIELRQISDALEPAVEAGLVEVVSIANATVTQIMDTFQKKRYKDRIAVFHYGGHADGYQLLLETDDGNHEVAHGAGLVSFLSHQQGLQLIFLNGCSTEQQSQELVDEGVPLVIGTTSSIADDIATRLAVRFYSSLGNGANIARAWREAEDEINIRGGSNVTRDMVMKFDKKGQSQEYIPWRFFEKEGAEIVKEWNLPDASNNPLFALPAPPIRDLPEEPFRFLKWYEEKHAEIFFGRSYHIRELYEQITDPHSAPLILLYGKSGVGKSSLLDAGLLPRLKQQCNVVYVRRQDDVSLVDSLRKQLSPEFFSQSSDESWQSELSRLERMHAESAQPLIKGQLSQLIQTLRLQKESANSGNDNGSWKETWMEKETITGKPFVIILDHAEGIYTHSGTSRAHEMEDLLKEIGSIFQDVSNRPKGKVMLAYRKEYHPEIEKICKTLLVPREQVFLEPLARRDIVDVVKGLASTTRLQRKYGLQVEELLPGIIADDLSADNNSSIAPILQILLTKMWQLTEGENERVFSVEKYQQLQKTGILLDDFFEQQIEKLKAWKPELENSGLVIDILNFHTTDFSTSGSRELKVLAERYQHRQEVIDELIQKLKELYLLADSGGMTSLAHDTLAPLVQNEFKNSDRPGQRAYRILENKAALYEVNQEAVIDEDDLELVESGQSGMRFWVKKEKELIEKSRQRRAELEAERLRNRRFKQVAVAALAAFALVVSWLGYQANQEAKANGIVATALEAEKLDATHALRLTEKALHIRPNNIAIKQTLARIYGDHEFYQQVYAHSSPILSMAISPDQEDILTGSLNGNIYRWNVDGKLIDSLSIHEGGTRAIAFSHDGKYLATGGEDNKIHIWDRQAKKIYTLTGHSNAINDIAFSPDGKQLLSGSRDNTSRLWNWETETLDTVLNGHKGLVYAVEFSPDNKLMVTGSEDGTAKIWTREGKLKHTLAEHTDRVLCVAFSPDSKFILTGSRDKTAILWDTTGKKIVHLPGHTARINSVEFSPTSGTLFTASDDRTVIQWGRDGEPIARYIGHRNYINCLTLSKDGKSMFTGSEDMSAKKWLLEGKVDREIRHFDKEAESRGYSNGIAAAAFSPMENLLATAGYKAYRDPIEEEFDMDSKSQKIRIRNLQNGKTYDFSGHKNGILSIAFSPDGKTLVSGSKDGTARLWAIDTTSTEKPESKTISKHKRETSAVAFSPDGSFFLTAGQDSLCRIWGPTGDTMAYIHHGAWITAVAIAPNGKHFATGGMDQKVKVWAIGNSKEPIRILEGHDAAVIALAFSPDGKHIASGGEDNVVNIWERSGRLVLKTKHAGKNISGAGAIRALAFSQDGNRLLFGAEDGTARVIDLKGNDLQTISASFEGISSVGFSPDGAYILTAGDDGIARLNLGIQQYLKSGRAARITK